MMEIDFDDEVASKRAKDIARVFAAHGIPDDRNTAIVMFIIGIKRIMSHYGPRAMASFASAFIDVWRQAEVQAISDALVADTLKDLFKQLFGEKDDETKSTKH